MAARKTACGAETKAGGKCRNSRAPDSKRCRVHKEKEGTVLQLVTGGKSTEAERPNQTMGANEAALTETLGALGDVADADRARYQMLRSLAKAVDETPGKAALWKEYREALNDFKKDAADAADSSLERAIEALRGASKVGN